MGNTAQVHIVPHQGVACNGIGKSGILGRHKTGSAQQSGPRVCAGILPGHFLGLFYPGEVAGGIGTGEKIQQAISGLFKISRAECLVLVQGTGKLPVQGQSGVALGAHWLNCR